MYPLPLSNTALKSALVVGDSDIIKVGGGGKVGAVGHDQRKDEAVDKVGGNY